MKTVLRLIASVVLLGIAVYLLDWQSLSRILVTLNPVVFCVAVLIAACLYLPMAYRWFMLVRAARPGVFRWHLQYFCMGTFLNTFTPANIGGDVYRFIMLRQNGRRYFVLLALFRERLLGLYSYLLGYLIFWFCYLLTGGQRSLVLDLLAGAIIVALMGLWGLPVLMGRIRRLGWFAGRRNIKIVIDACWRASRFKSVGEFVKLFFLSMVALGIWYVAILYLAYTMDIKIAPAALGIVVILAELIRLLPVSVQGIGMREGAYAYVFTLLGYSGEAGFALAAVGYLALTVAILLMGVVGAVLKQTGIGLLPKSGLSKVT
ncbi:MAG: lysylphosphatidylglycerol synthase transmembrane domain-containing protein [Methylobacter sp.]|uniref:lysylphosphatidylglycerol synthase transmembrane domain-containing protein n=1 Tax=Methylobacter sp. TaxID=2051955 RepID=UPI0027300159|nr:lysylphosphatidylglycerol synthase transmembrane domain-containing protein [Methylobacter sp.]MDP1665880.1 lysylphosphatidylglycerol synthase transmembrane domain-containing protein [Methylobacter sp.]